MAGRISEADIAEIKARTNIAELIGGYVALRAAGPGAYKGLCPFHGEKTPSFSVRTNPPLYHCFGCGEGGDVVAFIQRMESLSFADAIVRLADRIGYEVKTESGSNESSLRNRLVAANEAAVAYFHDQLRQPSKDSGFALQLLQQRGFEGDAIDRFELGFAPKGWSNLSNELKRLGFNESELLAAGLASQGNRGLADRFRGRLIWPIRDVNGQAIGFGARKLFEDDNGPKYLNTPETPLYKKNQVLYGLNLARREIVKRREIVVVEGYTDVMACHLAGVPNAVATCGTAFGEEHIRIVNRLFGIEADLQPAKIVFTFDPDSAGEKAAVRIWANQAKFNALTMVASGPAGLDPSDLRQQRGDEAIVQLVAGAKPLFEFVMRHRISAFDLRDVDSRIAAARAALPVLLELPDAGTRSAYIRQLSEWLSLSEGELSNILARLSNAGEAAATRLVGDLAQPAQSRGDSGEEVWQEQREDLAERRLLEALIQYPQFASRLELQKIAAAGLTTKKFQLLLELVVAESTDAGSDLAHRLGQKLPEAGLGLLRELLLTELPVLTEADVQRYCRGVIHTGIRRALEREKTELLAALRRTSEADSDRIAAIQRELVSLDAELSKLK